MEFTLEVCVSMQKSLQFLFTLVLSRVPEYSSTSLRALSIESHCLTRLLAMNVN